MHICECKIITDLDGFVAALKFFEEKDDPNITFEHEKQASPIQRIGPSANYQYVLTITASNYPPNNLYPTIRDLERRMDRTG